MSERRLAVHSFLWSALENGGLAALSFCCLLVFARYLSPAEFGLFVTALSIVELLGLFTTMLFHDALVQRESVSEEHIDTAFSTTIGLSIVLMGLCQIGGLLVATKTDQPQVASVVFWLSFVLPCSTVGAVPSAIQRRALQFRRLAVRSLVGRVCGAAGGIILATTGAGVWSLIVQQVSTALLGSLFLLVACERAPRLRFRLSSFIDLIGFGASSLAAITVRFAARRVFLSMAGFLLGPIEAGYLNMASRLVEMFWSIAASSISQVTLPILARLRNQPARLDRALTTVMCFSCALLLPCFVGLACTANDVIIVLTGPNWSPATWSVIVFSVTYSAHSLQLFAYSYMTAVGNPAAIIPVAVVEMCTMFTAMWLISPTTAASAAVVWSIAQVAYLLAMALQVLRSTGLGLYRQYSVTAAPLLAGCTMAALVLSLRRSTVDFAPVSRLGVHIAVGVLTYLIALFILNRRIVFDVGTLIWSLLRSVFKSGLMR